jgi:hypothetical protein
MIAWLTWSSSAFRPRGPSVTLTASARMLTPRSIASRACGASGKRGWALRSYTDPLQTGLRSSIALWFATRHGTVTGAARSRARVGCVANRRSPRRAVPHHPPRRTRPAPRLSLLCDAWPARSSSLGGRGVVVGAWAQRARARGVRRKRAPRGARHRHHPPRPAHPAPRPSLLYKLWQTRASSRAGRGWGARCVGPRRAHTCGEHVAKEHPRGARRHATHGASRTQRHAPACCARRGQRAPAAGAGPGMAWSSTHRGALPRDVSSRDSVRGPSSSPLSRAPPHRPPQSLPPSSPTRSCTPEHCATHLNPKPDVLTGRHATRVGAGKEADAGRSAQHFGWLGG